MTYNATPGRIEVAQGASVSTVFVFGDFDVHLVQAFKAAAHAILGSPGDRIVADLAGVTFFDSSAVGSLIAVGRAALEQGKSFALRNPGEATTQRLRVTGIDRVLSVEQNG